MYAGNIVESGRVAQVIGAPAHPYTRALLAAIPTRHVARGALQGLAGTVPDLIAPPPGCRFAPRCAQAQPTCTQAVPATVDVAPDHRVACVLAHA
jgi:oligopeptide/dipeptide ABC transporter ATP-binding protein